MFTMASYTALETDTTATIMVAAIVTGSPSRGGVVSVTSTDMSAGNSLSHTHAHTYLI